MKLLAKTAVIVLLSAAALGSAFAGFQCKVHNARGQVWLGTGATRSAASSAAMSFCVSHSTYARNCVVDWCRGAPAPVPASWQCNIHNARGQSWYGVGPTRSIAASNAIKFCSKGSTYASNCVVSSCFIK